MKIYLYGISKNKNSTLKYPLGEATISNAIIKDVSNMVNPTLIFAGASIGNLPINWNYCYIEGFNRYYFISDWTSDRNTWVANCEIDVLATWRNTIGDSYQFVLRSGEPGDVIDSEYIPRTYTDTIESDMVDIFADPVTPTELTTWDTHGTYIVKTICYPAIGGDSGITPGVNTYLMSSLQFFHFMRKISTTAYMGIVPEIDNISDNVAKMLNPPAQYILNCEYLPIALTGTNSLLTHGIVAEFDTTMQYGYYTLDLPAGAYLLNSYPKAEYLIYHKNVPKHPGASYDDRADYNYRQLYSEKYSRYQIEYPMFGIIDVPMNDEAIDAYAINIKLLIDLFDGSGTLLCDLLTEQGTIKKHNLPITRTKMAIQIPISAFIRDTTKVFSGAATAIAGTVGLVSGNVLSAPSILQGGVEAYKGVNSPQVNVSGEVGGFTSLYLRKKLILNYRMPNVPLAYSPLIGMATFKTKAIKDLANPTIGKSIIKCADAVIKSRNANEPTWTYAEYDMIINYLESGFYYD